ncbi:peroxiredoxin family protein [Ktedonospora formicarum]|uniref:Thioredoxin domain-containing protein n=1 Tax=Ktedonospora formicarum TaxID=2778364 RepID=A0A8J3I4V5_9CHLR|nr:TlpA disulfide reductase family protein [Ktedonospora formicarum]GHO45978.1 hypothetical protein KSX_41410 [Ktedonospora formicarum]
METILVISSVLLWVGVLGNLLLTLALIRRVNTNMPSTMSLTALSITGLQVGDVVPPFTARTLDGQAKTLDEYIGHATAFVFVSPDCEPCHNVLSTLVQVKPQIQQGETDLVLICNGDEKQARTLAERFPVHVPILIAPRKENSLIQDYQVQGTPSFYILDAQGKIQAAGHPEPHNLEWRKVFERWTRE